MANRRQTSFERALLAVQCAVEILELGGVPPVEALHVDLTVREFAAEFARRFARTHPDLVFRGDSTLERARLTRHASWALPRVVLRQGAPARSTRLR